jgi:hypothetical protein
MLPLQYLLPFAPSPAWWTARDRAIAMQMAIDQALAVASLGAISTGHAEVMASAERDDRDALPEQLRLIFPSPPHGARIVDEHLRDGALPDKEGGDDDAEDIDDVLDALMCGTPPKTPATAWAQIDRIVEGLRERGVTGHDALIRTIALLVSPSYRAQGVGPRFLLTAPPSAGKTFLLGALAETLGIPSLHIDASIITPEGWSGTNVSELMDSKLGVGTGRFTFEQWQNGAVLVLDEIDKACRANPDDRHGTQVRLERQHAMLGLVWGGTPIRLKDGKTLKTDRWIVAACGAFASSQFVAEQRPPTDAELIAWGMSPELVSRFPVRLTIAPQSIPALIERLQQDPRGLLHATQLAAMLGYTLEVPPQTLARLAVLMHASPATFTLRAASAVIVQAVIEQLAVGGVVRIGERLCLAPDDLPLVWPKRGRSDAPPEDTGGVTAP